MPITIGAEIRRLSQDEFGRIAYDVIRHAFDVHRELGRLFVEEVYHAELAHRCPNAQTEVPVKVSFDGFSKLYSIDLLVDGGAPFEIKAVDQLHDRHRAQLLNYMLLTEVAHGKLVNFRPTTMQHEFVNANQTRQQRRCFQVDLSRWQARETNDLNQRLIALLNDIGTGLSVELYEDAIIHWLGGPSVALSYIDVLVRGRRIGKQLAICTQGRAAIKVTAFESTALRPFEDQCQRFVNHTALSAFHWVNISRSTVRLQTFLQQGS